MIENQNIKACFGSKEGGYTLIEILVSINISFILVSLLIIVFLFTSRLTTSSIKQIESKTRITTFLSGLYQRLERAESYTFQKNGNEYTLTIDETEGVSFSTDKISGDGLIDMDDTDSYKLSIIYDENNRFSLVNGNSESDTGLQNESNMELTSYNINCISLVVQTMGKKFMMVYKVPKFLKSNFKNIVEKDV